jgi:hypothetical protein
MLCVLHNSSQGPCHFFTLGYCFSSLRGLVTEWIEMALARRKDSYSSLLSKEICSAQEKWGAEHQWEVLQQHSAETMCTALPPSHPSTAASLAFHAGSYWQGSLAESVGAVSNLIWGSIFFCNSSKNPRNDQMFSVKRIFMQLDVIKLLNSNLTYGLLYWKIMK